MSKHYESPPRFILILLIFFAPLVLFSCVSTEQHNLNESNTAADTRIWNFGQVKEGVVLEHSFILRNSWDKPLAISGMHTSCGCTVSEAPKKNLLPGEHTPINVKFHTQGYSGMVEQYVYVHTDDAMEPIIKFSIKAELVK
jgi:hypothetical protein